MFSNNLQTLNLLILQLSRSHCARLVGRGSRYPDEAEREGAGAVLDRTRKGQPQDDENQGILREGGDNRQAAGGEKGTTHDGPQQTG